MSVMLMPAAWTRAARWSYWVDDARKTLASCSRSTCYSIASHLDLVGKVNQCLAGTASLSSVASGLADLGSKLYLRRYARIVERFHFKVSQGDACEILAELVRVDLCRFVLLQFGHVLVKVPGPVSGGSNDVPIMDVKITGIPGK